MHTPKFTSIQSVTSPIFAKEIVKIRAMAIPIPENRGWVKTTQQNVKVSYLTRVGLVHDNDITDNFRLDITTQYS